MHDPHFKPSLRDLEGASWTALFAGPIAWFADQQVSYALVPWACAGGPAAAIHAANVVALAIVLVGAALGLRGWRRTGSVSDELDRPSGRARFLGLLGLMLCLFFALPIVLQGVAGLILDPCQK
jgi:hypothetical protein